MQKRTIISILSFVFVFSFFQLEAQVRTTNEKGEAIIRYSDGTWEYAEPQSSISETDSRKKAQKLAIEARRSEAEKIKVEKLAQLEYDRLKTKVTYMQDAEEKKVKKSELKLLKSKLKTAKSARKKASKNARFYEGLIDMPTEKREAALAKKIEKDAVAQRKAEREQLGLEAETLADEERPKKPKKAKKTRKEKVDVETEEPSRTREKIVRTTEAPKIPGVLTRMDKINLAEKRHKELNKKYDTPIRDYSNKKDCSFAFNEKDEFTGESKKGLNPRLFFTNTDEALIPFMNGEDFLVCEGYLAQVSGGRIVLALTYTMKSVDAIRQYGRLDAGSALKLKLLDGTSISLWNNREDPGVVNKRKQTTVYQGFYNISQSDLKKLKKSEVSKARVVWSSGYDNYEVYELDFFKEQLECFDL